MKGNSMANTLKDKVIFITGGSRGIGREMALRCAKDGANIVIAAKTSEPHPSLPGTIHTVASEVEQLGGKALPIVVDVRHEEQVVAAVEKTIATFGQIDALINNASAINLSGTLDMPMKRFDLLSQVNVRATYMCSKFCLPHLIKSENPHIINLSPPLNMQAKWFKDHLAYTISKYGMSMCTLGLSEEFKEQGVAVNSLWPKAIVATAAIEVNFPKQFYAAARKPQIVADAAYEILISDSREVTGNFFTDEEVLASRGVTDFDQYAQTAGQPLIPDFYLE
jgi:citronellol/citronellal dehydrogenase